MSNRVKSGRPKSGSRIIDLVLIVASVVVLVYAASFVLKFSQGAAAPENPQQAGQPQVVAPISLKLQVLNGCGVAGMAARFGKQVTELGKPEFIIDVIDERNFGSAKQDTTILIARKNNLQQAQQLARKLGIPSNLISVKALEDNYLNIDYSVVIGADYNSYLSRRANN